MSTVHTIGIGRAALGIACAAVAMGCAARGTAAPRPAEARRPQPPARQPEPAAPGTAITIYSTAAPGAIPPEWYRPVPGQPEYQPYTFMPSQIPGYAVVRQTRPMTLPQGRGTVKFRDVAALIDPTTVLFSSLTDPDGTHVLEQNYQFDLVSGQKMLERFLDKEVTVEMARGDKEVATVRGTLLSATGGSLILRLADGGVQMINGYSNIRFPQLPEGLITRPTLVWDVEATKAGEHNVRVAYQTTGVTWWADYNLVFQEGKDANSGVLDVGAWVSILNQSGATYPDAKLKLIAGDVHRAPQSMPMNMPRRAMADGLAAQEAKGFEEKSFFEYHLYTLGRPSTLPDRSTKQIELFDPVSGVPAEKVLVYYGLEGQYWGFGPDPMVDRELGVQGNKKLDIYLTFRNEKKNGMGMPLPSGRIRVSKRDPADGSLEFIGEDTIDHTPRDEKVLVRMGNAFDVVGERRQVDFSVDTRAHWMDETIEVTIRNHKDEPVKVIVKENAYRWVNWKIVDSTHEYEKVDARTIHFPVTVDKDGEVKVRYKIHYSW